MGVLLGTMTFGHLRVCALYEEDNKKRASRAHCIGSSSNNTIYCMVVRDEYSSIKHTRPMSISTYPVLYVLLSMVAIGRLIGDMGERFESYTVGYGMLFTLIVQILVIPSIAYIFGRIDKSL